MITAAGVYAELYPLAAHARHIDHLYVLKDSGRLAPKGAHVFASPFFEVQVICAADRGGSVQVRVREPHSEAQPRRRPFHGLIAGIRLSRRLPSLNVDARWRVETEKIIANVAAPDTPLDLLVARLDDLAARVVAMLDALAVDVSATDIVRTQASARTVEAIARTLNVSSRTVRRHIRAKTGLAAKKLQGLVRFRHALHCLAANDTPLASLAHEAGYADQAHLTLAFSKHAGISPARLRTVARRRNDSDGAVRFFQDTRLAARVTFLQMEPAET